MLIAEFKNLARRNKADPKRLKLGHDVFESLQRQRISGENTNKSIDDIVYEIAQKYRISEKTVWNAWSWFRNKYEYDK